MGEGNPTEGRNEAGSRRDPLVLVSELIRTTALAGALSVGSEAVAAEKTPEGSGKFADEIARCLAEDPSSLAETLERYKAASEEAGAVHVEALADLGAGKVSVELVETAQDSLDVSNTERTDFRVAIDAVKDACEQVHKKLEVEIDEAETNSENTTMLKEDLGRVDDVLAQFKELGL